jgi:hypothetical protein
MRSFACHLLWHVDMLVIWVELYRNKLWVIEALVSSSIFSCAVRSAEEPPQYWEIEVWKIPGYNLTFSSLVSSLNFLCPRRILCARKPSGIGLILELLLSCLLRQIWVTNGMVSNLLRFATPMSDLVRTGRKSLIERLCPLPRHGLPKDLVSGSCFLHLGSCTCTVDTFMNIMFF